MTSCDILYILRQFIIQFCGTMSYTFFFLLIQGIARFFRLVLLSFMIYVK